MRFMSFRCFLPALALAFFADAAAAAPMGFDEARHLLNRTGFGASESEVEDYAQLSRGAAVERLLRESSSSAATPAPAWINDAITPPRVLKSLSDEDRQAERRETLRKSLELRAWWYREMLTTRSPLTEKMTLFWHNHFVSSQHKVRYPQLMYRQNVLLRRHALGNFGALLHAISRDSAMLIYLDGASNRKAQPNENFARELMELFTLGEGHYSESDVKEAARAFTGWSIEPATGEYRWRRFQHDDGIKTVLDRSGRLDGDAVLEILLARPETAQFVARKLWREFVSPNPDEAEVGRIAGAFRASGYDIKTALRALLTSDAFYAAANRASLVKSPVEFLVGTLRQFDIRFENPLPLAFAGAALGQNIFSPPNVKGWPGGEYWINSTTLLARKQFIERIFRARETRNGVQLAAAGGNDTGKVKGMSALGSDVKERIAQAYTDIQFDADKWFAQFPGRDERRAARLVLAAAAVDPPTPQAHGLELVRELAQDPAYQLK